MQTGIAVVDKRIDIAVGYGIDAAAAPAIAAVRAASGDEFFAAKARCAIAAFASDDFDGCFVYEFHDQITLKKQRVKGAFWGALASGASLDILKQKSPAFMAGLSRVCLPKFIRLQ
jgi:hypothetical protein